MRPHPCAGCTVEVIAADQRSRGDAIGQQRSDRGLTLTPGGPVTTITSPTIAHPAREASFPACRATMLPCSAPAELVQAVVVDAEVVGDLVHHGDRDLARTSSRVVHMRSVGPRKIVIRSGSEPAAQKLSRSVSGTPSYTPSRSGSSPGGSSSHRKTTLSIRSSSSAGTSSRASPTASSNSSGVMSTRPSLPRSAVAEGGGTGERARWPLRRSRRGHRGCVPVPLSASRWSRLPGRASRESTLRACSCSCSCGAYASVSATLVGTAVQLRGPTPVRASCRASCVGTVVVSGRQLGRGDGVDAVREVEARHLGPQRAP